MTMPAPLAAGFDPIGLAEVEATASLSVRTDRKYVVEAEAFAQLARRLAPTHRALEIDGQRVFAYDSIYFDTPDLTSYRQHVQGRRRRFKCRTRLYVGGSCFFEVKLKGRRGETVKRRLEMPAVAHGTLLPEAREFLGRELDAAYGLAAPEALAAMVGTAFARVTLVSADARERVTCDFGLAFRCGGGRFGIADGRVVVETKTGDRRGVADSQLLRLGARPVGSCSKYCLGVALTHPNVRSNRFRWLIRRYFAEQVAAA